MVRPEPRSHLQLNTVAKISQRLGGEFWSYVALGSAEQFEADHEFSYARGTQERREKMRVQMPLVMRLAIRGSLMKTHGVRERRIEQAVITGNKLLQYVGKLFILFDGQSGNICRVLAREN